MNESTIKAMKFGMHLCLLIVFFWLFLIAFFGLFYVHEFGHMLFGSTNTIITEGHLSKTAISVWIDHPLLPFVKLPQQTKVLDGKGSVNFIFGGIIFTILISLLIAFYGYRFSKDKLWFLFPVPIMIHEIFGNYFCGTDNFTNNPLTICNSWNLGLFSKYSVWLFVLLMLILLIRSQSYKKLFAYLLNVRKPKTYRQITKLQSININDPQKEKKIMYIKGVNRLSDLINSVQRDMEDRIVVFLSIFFSALLGAFLTAELYVLSTLTFGILLLLVLIALIKEARDKKRLYLQLDTLVKEAKSKVGLDIRQ